MRQASARAALREATKAVHERLHHVPAFAALAAGALDRAGYRALLARLYGFHAPMEAAMAEALAGRFAPAAWQRADLLRADLAALGEGEPTLARLPRIRPPARLSDPEAMGCLYVLEGSTLGGRHLARQLDFVLPPGSTAGRSFLAAGSQPHRIRWADLGAALDAAGTDPAALRAMLAGAADAFARYEAWFADRPA